MDKQELQAKLEDVKFLRAEYVDARKSTTKIAQELGTHPNTVRRALIKAGVDLRNKSAAQDNYLSSNPHPMEGRRRTEEEKEKISLGIQTHLDSLDKKELKRRKKAMSKVAKEKWASLDDAEKKKTINKMHSASREAAGQGSKNENMVSDLLTEAGYKVMQRTNQYTPLNAFEIDIAIPSIHVAIEWDGAAHFQPIYGEEHLKKNMAKDERKNRVLLDNGWTVIRCRDHSTAHSLAFCRRAVAQIINTIQNGAKGVVHILEAE
jgi:very-short-patch-repair endonuclease